MILQKFILIVIFFISMSFPSLANADVDKGLAAAERGDFETAHREWLISANQEDADAQFNLGAMNYYGEGVHKNYLLHWAAFLRGGLF